MNTVPFFLERLSESFQNKAFFVGGCVRDKYFGFDSKDIDIEVFGHDYDAICEAVRSIPVVQEVFECGKSFNVVKVRLICGADLDIAVPRREVSTGGGHKDYVILPDPTMSPEEASARRDFSMNALMETFDGEIIDFHNGVQDLKTQRLRAIGNSFLDDPLRVLRGMQFAGRFGLRVEEHTAYLCALISGRVLTMSKERIWGEWEKLLSKSDKPSFGIQFLEDTGAIVLYPELSALDGLRQDPTHHPEGCVLTHTKMVLDEGARIAQKENLDHPSRLVFLLACICHDFGKALTTTMVDGRISCHGHAEAGSEMTAAFLDSIGAPAALREPVNQLCLHHMALASGDVTAKQVRKLASKINRTSSLGMLKHLIVADNLGRGSASRYPAAVDEMMELAKAEDITSTAPKPLLQGRDLVRIGLKQGPMFGRILNDVYEMQLDGQICSLDEAVGYVAKGLENNQY